MLPANARIVFCPYCGGTKELMSLMSGNTFGARYWSDLKMQAPMLPQISPVQKCPHCGKYYLYYKQKSEDGERPSFELGELSYPEWKEAYSPLQKERENSNQLKKVDERDLSIICLNIIQAYNDYYERDCRAEFSSEEWYYKSKVVMDFIKNKNKPDDIHPFLIPELFREIGIMDPDFLSMETYEKLEGVDKIYYDGIKERMEADDTKVFQLIF